MPRISAPLVPKALDLSDLLPTTSTGTNVLSNSFRLFCQRFSITGLGKALVASVAMGLMATTRKAQLLGEIPAHLSTPSSIQPWAMATTNQRSHLPLPHWIPTRRLLMKDKRRNVTDEMGINLKAPNLLLQPSHLCMAPKHSNMVACTNNANSSHSNIVLLASTPACKLP